MEAAFSGIDTCNSEVSDFVEKGAAIDIICEIHGDEV